MAPYGHEELAAGCSNPALTIAALAERDIERDLG